MILAIAAAKVQLGPVLEIELSRGCPLISYRSEAFREGCNGDMVGSCGTRRRIDNPDILVRVIPQKLSRSTTDAVIPGDPSADENPAPFPLRKGKRLEPGC